MARGGEKAGGGAERKREERGKWGCKQQVPWSNEGAKRSRKTGQLRAHWGPGQKDIPTCFESEVHLQMTESHRGNDLEPFPILTPTGQHTGVRSQQKEPER